MASVYERSLTSGKFWFASVRLSDGRWKSYNTGLATNKFKRRAALDHANGTQSEIDAGRDPFRKESTNGNKLSTATTKYIAERRPFWGARTTPLHSNTFKLLIEAIGDIPTQNVGKPEINRFIEHLRRRGANNTGTKRPLSLHTVNVHLRNLRAFIRWAGHEFDFNPIQISERPVPSSGHRDYYTEDECRRLIAAASEISVNGQPLSHFILFLILTGMRKGEALELRWEWIDFGKHQILIPPEVTKTQRKRVVPIMSVLQSMMLTWPRETDRVFKLSIVSGHLKSVYEKAVVNAGIRRLKMHNLRDTFAVHSLLAGVPLAVVSAILGHASVSTTIQHYGSIVGEELQQAAEKSLPFSTAILPEFVSS